MDINSKFIYAKTRAAFEREIPNIPEYLKPIVFIEDTKEMWTMGTYFSIGYPSLIVSEKDGIVKVELGDSNFTITTSGESLSIRKGTGNSIIISSNALTKVDTESPLHWDSLNKKLLHSESGVTVGSYGQSSNLDNGSIFNIPNIVVDKYGHIVSASTKIVAIRDYVEQLAPSNSESEKNILLSYNEVSNNSDTAQTRKANGLTFNDATKKITVPGGANIGGPVNVSNGDLTVIGGQIIGDLRGNVTGEATPKIHISTEPEYGGASTEMYGHVKVQDTLGVTAPPQSSNNADPGNPNVTLGVAASPYMVWSVKNELSQQIQDLPTLGGIQIGNTVAEITTQGQIIEVQASNGVSAVIEDNIIKLKGVQISGLNPNKESLILNDKFTIGEDFVIEGEDNKMSLRWLELT